MYRSIGIARTGFMSINQIRPDKPEAIKAIEWVCFGANPFNVVIPFYTNTNKMPKYVSDVTTDVDTNNFYWTSRLIGALADSTYSASIQNIDRYQNEVAAKSHEIINEYDKKMIESNDFSLIDQANEEICKMAKRLATKTLNDVLMNASKNMKCNYNRADN